MNKSPKLVILLGLASILLLLIGAVLKIQGNAVVGIILMLPFFGLMAYSFVSFLFLPQETKEAIGKSIEDKERKSKNKLFSNFSYLLLAMVIATAVWNYLSEIS
jgi:hypothetical protein